MGLPPSLAPLGDHLQIRKQAHCVSQLNLHIWCKFHRYKMYPSFGGGAPRTPYPPYLSSWIPQKVTYKLGRLDKPTLKCFIGLVLAFLSYIVTAKQLFFKI